MDSGQPLLNIKKLLKTQKSLLGTRNNGRQSNWKDKKKKEAVGEQEAETATELMIEK